MSTKIPYGRQSIDSIDIQAVTDTLQADFLTQGPKVKEFEDKFAEYVGSKYAVAVNNATSGLHLAVLSMGLKAGDNIITTPITFASTANCARFVGANVYFADIDADTYLLDIESVERVIASKPKGFFKGIHVVDFAGLPVHLENYRALCDKHNLYLLEDACHAPGGYFTDTKGVRQKCGNGAYADVATFSFHPVKHIACGEGGMITTNSDTVYKSLLSLRTHGITKNNMEENHGGWYYEMHELGYNYRLTDIQSALGITQLAKNNIGVERRNEIANAYKAAFRDRIKFQSIPQGSMHAHHLFVVEVENRKELYDALHTEGVLAHIHYIPLHTLPYYISLGIEQIDLPKAEQYYSQCISLPMYPTLSDEEQNMVIEKVLTNAK